MKFALQVNSAPYSGQGSETAWRFAVEALRRGHEIRRVFFYFEGVYNALGRSEPPADEKDLIQCWSRLAAEHDIDLVLCVSACSRRGLGSSDPNDGREVQSWLAEGFRISGLGQWVEAAIEADRLLVFGD